MSSLSFFQPHLFCDSSRVSINYISLGFAFTPLQNSWLSATTLTFQSKDYILILKFCRLCLALNYFLWIILQHNIFIFLEVISLLVHFSCENTSTPNHNSCFSYAVSPRNSKKSWKNSVTSYMWTQVFQNMLHHVDFVTFTHVSPGNERPNKRTFCMNYSLFFVIRKRIPSISETTYWNIKNDMVQFDRFSLGAESILCSDPSPISFSYFLLH